MCCCKCHGMSCKASWSENYKKPNEVILANSPAWEVWCISLHRPNPQSLRRITKKTSPPSCLRNRELQTPFWSIIIKSSGLISLCWLLEDASLQCGGEHCLTHREDGKDFCYWVLSSCLGGAVLEWAAGVTHRTILLLINPCCGCTFDHINPTWGWHQVTTSLQNW